MKVSTGKEFRIDGAIPMIVIGQKNPFLQCEVLGDYISPLERSSC
jgi:hypothetical protein